MLLLMWCGLVRGGWCSLFWYCGGGFVVWVCWFVVFWLFLPIWVPGDFVGVCGLLRCGLFR